MGCRLWLSLSFLPPQFPPCGHDTSQVEEAPPPIMWHQPSCQLPPPPEPPVPPSDTRLQILTTCDSQTGLIKRAVGGTNRLNAYVLSSMSDCHAFLPRLPSGDCGISSALRAFYTHGRPVFSWTAWPGATGRYRQQLCGRREGSGRGSIDWQLMGWEDGRMGHRWGAVWGDYKWWGPQSARRVKSRRVTVDTDICSTHEHWNTTVACWT